MYAFEEMEGAILGQGRLMVIQVMHREGKSIRAISRALGVSRNTVRKYIREGVPPVYGPRSKRYRLMLLLTSRQDHTREVPKWVTTLGKQQVSSRVVTEGTGGE